MWLGAVTLYGIGVKVQDVLLFLKFLMSQEGTEAQNKRLLSFLKSDLQLSSLDELSTESSGIDVLLNEAGALYSPLLQQLDLSIVNVPHDLSDWQSEPNIAVVGKTVCLLREGREPIISSCDHGAVQNRLAEIFGPARCLPGDGPSVTNTALSFYTLPLDCHCCS